MARHSMTINMISVYPKRKPEDPHSHLDSGEIHLIDELALLADECRDESDTLGNVTTQQYARVSDVVEAPRWLQVTFQIGYYGNEGPVVDTTDGETKYLRTANDASLVSTRALLLVPPKAKKALWFTEVAQGVCGGSRLLAKFSSRWQDDHPELTFHHPKVLEGDAWIEAGNVSAVRGEVYSYSTDSADADVPTAVEIEQEVRPAQGPWFAPGIRRVLRDEDLRGTLFALPAGTGVDRISVEVQGENGKKKWMELSEEKTPTVRYILSEGNAASPSDEDFRSACFTIARDDIYPLVGGEWQAGWESMDSPPESGD